MPTPIKVLFLDFDGVLNSSEWFFGAEKGIMFPTAPQKKRSEEKFKRSQDKFERDNAESLSMIDPNAVVLLNQICNKFPNLDIVISSAWRIIHELDDLREFLRIHGFEYANRIIDRTPSGPSGVRGIQIRDWIVSYPKWEIESIVILDDNSDMDMYMPFLVQTSWAKGLQQENVDSAIKILTTKHPAFNSKKGSER